MKKSVVIYLHIFLWIAIFCSDIIKYLLRQNSIKNPSNNDVLFMLYGGTIVIPLFFYLGYFLIMKTNRLKYILISLIGVLIFYFILYLKSETAFTFGITILSTRIIIWTTIGILFRFFIDWFNKKNNLLILERENVSSNMALLKSQINPHFLFNTLHNIDTLIYQNQDKASKSLEKLSDIMRYMLKDASSDFADLQTEIDHLENYLSLEKLRLKNENFLTYEKTGDDKGFKIAPMILIPFVENAFKHSVDSNIENGIIIKILIENQKLIFICENKFDKTDTDKDNSHGIGLETVKKRLDLIYKKTHKLLITVENSVYKVYLEIELNEN